MSKDKLWYEYCKALNIDPKSKAVLNSSYYIDGFEEWKRLRRDFNYYSYCANNA